MISTNYLKVLLPLVLAAAILAIWSSSVSAQDAARPSMELIVPAAAVGDVIDLQAVLLVEGVAVPEAEITFFRATEFMNNGSDLVIGIAMTNTRGVATVTYVPRTEGEILVLAEFEGMDGFRGAFAETTLIVGAGPGQYKVEAGVSVPGVNVSFLVAILSAVWGTFFFVMFLIWQIARDGSMTPASEGGQSE
ncbi:MAG: hypothetical protein HQ478_12395 [Chloroflexi bacterium]|nr:hypothetical protein [Chloroflexota bacterium]